MYVNYTSFFCSCIKAAPESKAALNAPVVVEVTEFDINEKLFNEIRVGNLHAFDELLDKYADKCDINRHMSGHWTMLHYACLFGEHNFVEYLIRKKGANVNIQVDLVTPLMAACQSTCHGKITEAIVEMLLEKDAVINVSDRFGTTPLMLAIQNNHIKVAKYFIKFASLEARDNDGNTVRLF